jgi:hypothetical protein
LFNNILSTGKFPVVWAKGIIVPIFKSGEKCNPSNYRGITIGSCIGKLFLKMKMGTIIPFAHTTGNLPVLKILLNNLQSGSII